jgi:hypothetical protein
MRCTLSTFFRLGTVPRVSGESAPVLGIAGGVALSDRGPDPSVVEPMTRRLAYRSGHPMRAALALTVLLIGLIVFTPFAWASTYEAWLDGLYDVELQNDLLALSTSEIVINGTVLASSGRVDVVVAVVSPGDDSLAALTDLSPRSARAPPTA